MPTPLGRVDHRNCLFLLVNLVWVVPPHVMEGQAVCLYFLQSVKAGFGGIFCEDRLGLRRDHDSIGTPTTAPMDSAIYPLPFLAQIPCREIAAAL